MKRYVCNVAVAFSMLFAAILGHDPHMPLCANCHGKEGSFCRWLCRLLNNLEDEHCRKSRLAHDPCAELMDEMKKLNAAATRIIEMKED